MSFLSKVTEMSWATPGLDEELHSHQFSEHPPKRVALRIFLAVVTSLFFLFVMAYRQRMGLGDWNPIAEPAILWINTALLVLASIAMQIARNAAERGTLVNKALLLSGLFAVAFLVGQFIAWWQLAEQGFYTLANPAYAFFVLLTALHGLHLLGGLYVWARTLFRIRGGADAEDTRLTIQLCAVYWHYLLLAWAVLFALMLTT